LWIAGGDAALWKPVSFSLAIGYALDPRLAIVARASSWLRFGELANEYFGAGVLYRFESNMNILGTLGASFTRDADWVHRFQGVGLQADIGQSIALSSTFECVLGAHFQLGTPFGGSDLDAFTSIETGLFVAFGLR